MGDNLTYNQLVRRIRVIRAKFLILDVEDKDEYLKTLNRIAIEADMRISDDRNLSDLMEQLDEVENQLMVH